MKDFFEELWFEITDTLQAIFTLSGILSLVALLLSIISFVIAIH